MDIIYDHKKEAAWVSGTHYEKEWVEELILTRSEDGKRSMGRQREKYLTNLSRWVAEQLPMIKKDEVKKINLLRTAKDRSIWKPMIAHALHKHGT